MKFKRILATVIALILTLPILLLTVWAHPGGTDSAGGHTDHDTGEYHYHHGYPAHDHADTDGDGYVECPYRPDWEDRQAAWHRYTHSWKPEYNTLVLMVMLSFLAHLFAYAANYGSHIGKKNLCRIFDAAWVVCAILSIFPSLLLVGSLYYLRTRKIVIKQPIEPPVQAADPPPQTEPVVDSEPLPPEYLAAPDPDMDFRIVLLPESGVSVHARCRDTCRYLWYETLMLRSSTSPPVSSDACVYLWTALFYTAVKTLRNQDSVNRIYSYFSEVTKEFVTEEEYADLVVAKVRSAYRSLRQPLNESGIDPRSGNGRLSLWNFLISFCPELLQRPDLRPGFLAATERVWKTVAKVFKQSHPTPKLGHIQYSIGELPET